jgi:acyl transferase domain-containing protein
MKDFLQRIEKLPPKHLVLLALEQKARIDKLERAQREPIAIVGMGCRFPGDVDSPESFWDLLTSGRDGITEIPPERFDVDAWYDPDPAVPGKIATRWGGFVRDVDRFDASFFGISRREAVSMDPQQRILLETSWEAMERAGIATGSLSGSRLGIFFGLSTADYYQLLMRTGHAAIDGYTATGTAHSIAAGRLAYLLGVHGPNFVVDTACSSSLVALHLACQSLRAGECEMALAGGANLILLPETTIALSKARMLAPDGRCKAFDEAADGFVRSEGCGVVVLKALTRALDDRDNILAIIRGSAVNQDGRSSGLTAPNGLAQEKVIREAMESAGVGPSEVQYVEAHGTGTSLGDPIEAHALASVFGAGRSAQNPLYVGSAKSNIGHLEAAAGIAGLIKTVLSLQHGSIPATLHFRQLNSHIDLKGAPLVVTAQNTPWPRRHRIAGISSFGFSGTNTHVILEEAPARVRVARATDSSYTLVVSARTKTALSVLAQRYADYLAAHPDLSLGDFCHTAAEGRNRFDHTVTLSASSTEQLRAKLAGVAAGNGKSDSGSAPVKTSGDKIVLPVYPFERQRYWVEIRSSEPTQEHGEIGFYHLEWERKPVASHERSVGSSAGLSAEALHAIGQRVASNLDSLSREHGLDRYVELQPELDRASSEYIMRALRECGWSPEIGEVVRAEELSVRLGIRSRYVRSLGRMLEILGEDGILERVGQSWKVLNVPAPADTDSDFPLLHAAYPQFRGELTFLKNCGAKLAQVMQGRLDALNLLFPDGSFETAEELYEKSAGARVFQTLIQQVIAQMLEPELAEQRPM